MLASTQSLTVFIILTLLAPSEGQGPLTSTQTYPLVQGPDYSSFSSNCVSLIHTCPPTGAICANEICSVCTSLDITPSIEPCCAAATPIACFSDLLAGNPITYTTPPGPLSSGITSYISGAISCSAVNSVLNSCAAATPGFTNLELSEMATCLCTVSGKYSPQVYDAYFSTCLAWLSTALPDEYSAIGESDGMPYIRTPCEHLATDPTAFPLTTMPPTPTPTVSGLGVGATVSSAPKPGGGAGRVNCGMVALLINYLVFLAPLAI